MATAVDAMSSTRTQKAGLLAPLLSRIVMVPPMLIMALIGSRFITNPSQGAAATGVTLSTPEAITDTRVMGALAFTIAFALATFISSRSRLRMGHITIVAMMLLILAVRIFGFAVDGTTLAMGGQKVKFTGELVFLTLNAIALALQTRLSGRSGVQR
jgi:hypothetical protein